MDRLTNVYDTDFIIIKYLDADTIVSVLDAKDKYFNDLILKVIDLYKKNDQAYLSRLLIWTNENKNDVFSKYLIELGADIHLGEYLTRTRGYFNKNGEYNDNQALRWASWDGHIQVVKFLVKKCVDSHAYNEFTLRWAVRYGHTEVVKFLVEQGADIHVNNNEVFRWTAENEESEMHNFLNELTIGMND